MCTYNITVNDSLIERARPAIGAGTDIEQWMQKQMETLLIHLASSAQETVGNYSPDMSAILSFPRIDMSEYDLNGEQARMDYYKETQGVTHIMTPAQFLQESIFEK